MKTLAIAILLLAAFALSRAQSDFSSGRVKLQPAGATLTEAVGIAIVFLEKLSIAPGKPEHFSGMLSKVPGMNSRRVRGVQNQSADINIDTVSRDITSYVDRKRQDDRCRNRNRIGAKFMTTEVGGKAHLRAVA